MTKKYCLGSWVWYCTYEGCTSCSKKPLSRMLALRGAVRHMRDFHNNIFKEPILRKVE